MIIGEIIQARRMALGLSQEGLAELVGVSRQAVSKWEVGDAVPDTDKLVPLARTLKISVDELLGNVPEGPPPEEKRRPASPGRKGPGWFALHWYWLGLIPVAWGCWMLIQMVIVLLSLGTMSQLLG